MSKGWTIVVGVVIVIAALVAWNATRPDAVVEVVSPHRQTVRAYVEEQAVTELPHDYLISMPIAGWLEPIWLREGDPVANDDVVARLETDDLKDRVHQAEQRIAVLEAKIAETSDHRLEENALVETRATVKAIDETVSAAEAKLEATRAVMDFTQTELDRVKRLMEDSSATDRELREAELEFRKARADHRSDQLELAALKTIAAVSYIGPKFITDYIDRKSFTLEQQQKELAEAKTQLAIEQRNLSRAEIRSPVDGIVLERYQTRRQYLGAGTPLLALGRLDDMEVVAEVLTQRATRIAPGNPVEIFGEALPAGPIDGSVLRVYPAGFKKISSLGVEQQRVKVAIKPDERPAGLGVSFRLYVRVVYAQATDALALPRTCLFRADDGGWEVMKVVADRLESQPIDVGLMNADEVEVVGGLTADDWVVTRPSRELSAGMRVRVVQDGRN